MVRTTLHKASGQTVHIRELSKRLKQKGVEVRIFTLRVEGDSSPANITEVKFKGSNTPFIRNLGFMTRCGLQIEDFDIVHTQYHPDVFTGVFVQVLRRIPHVFTFHGYAPTLDWINPVQKLKMTDHALGTFVALHAGVDRVIAVSQYLKSVLTRFYRLDGPRISVVYNGVDDERFHPEIDGSRLRDEYGIADSPTVLFLGRMDPYKGLRFLLRAVPLILRQLPEAKFVIAGGTRFDQVRLMDLISSSTTRNALLFTGHVPEDEVPSLFAACDIFCSPSMWEGFGLTLAEAQASAKPVVAFDHYAIPEVIEDGVTGILVRPGDHYGLAEALTRLLKNSSLRQEMGMEGRKRVQRLFNWELVAERTLEVYKQATESRGQTIEN